jgi:hypothetical protein
MGGDIITHFAKGRADGVGGIINIEGNLTPDDLFTSAQAVEADERGEFEKWFREDFMSKTVLEAWGQKRVSCLRYYASLWFCRPEAFRLCAHEIYRQNVPVPETSASRTGLVFQNLRVPKVYCRGGQIPEGTKKFIGDGEIPNWEFEDAFHWLMIDEAKEFYHRLAQFCSDDWASRIEKNV